MAKITYASLKLKVDNTVDTFDFQGNQIEVLKYLPIQDKYDLIMTALEKAEENGIYNPIMLEMYFHLYLVYMYTNITFTEKQREDELKLYDALQSNGIISMILEKISESEYNTLCTYLNETAQHLTNHQNTFGFFAKYITSEILKKFDNLQSAVNSFDREKFDQIISLAQTLNGDREI